MKQTPKNNAPRSAPFIQIGPTSSNCTELTDSIVRIICLFPSTETVVKGLDVLRVGTEVKNVTVSDCHFGG